MSWWMWLWSICTFTFSALRLSKTKSPHGSWSKKLCCIWTTMSRNVMHSIKAAKQSIHDCFSTRMCLQGLNRVGKDSQVGRGGVQRKDWHDYEAIKRDSSRSGKSRTPHRCNRPIPSQGLIALQLCSNHVNLRYGCSSSVIHTVYICYSNHQLGFTFCWGKSASIQTVHIIRKGFVPEMSR